MVEEKLQPMTSKEDFAENFSSYLKDPNLLKAKSTIGYEWFLKKYSANFKLKKACQNEKE